MRQLIRYPFALVLLSATILFLASCGGNINEVEAPEFDGSDVQERVLAELHYKNGAHVVFSYDEVSKDYGLLQEGQIGKSAPLVLGDVQNLLEVYLDITPRDMPVPDLLLAEAGLKTKDITEANMRKKSASVVTAKELDLPVEAALRTTGQSCYSVYYSWWDWHDAATLGMAPKSYYASSFGGKKRYSDSYILNCVPNGSPDYLWARHRIYYKNAFGNYVKHFEGKVAPWHWQAKQKGSVKRYRRVSYDDNWNSSPSCGICKYTREGRFHN